ncbi:MAG: lysozyme inhibitor LprI family protein [Neisseria sp.]|nr:lysozyme inhibitor LprI family protein [Neisseria sp.]
MSIKHLLFLPSFCALLTACQPDVPQYGDTPSCTDSRIPETVKSGLQQYLAEQAQAFAAQDSRGFVDADRVAAAADGINIILNGASQEETRQEAICRGHISISLPENVLDTVNTNAPLLYGERTLNQIIRQQTAGTGLNYNGNGVFDQTLSYTLQTDADGNLMLLYRDEDPSTVYNALLTALLPYGIKDILIINGQPLTREQALQAHSNQAVETVKTIEEIKEEEASTEFASPDEPEILSPETKETEIPFSAEDLAYARQNHLDAENEIEAQWQQIDSEIRQELAEEQADWNRRKNRDCSQAAAPSKDSKQAEYRRLQCDARMTRERIQYLKGYHLP